jgi:molybdopterin converting factor small subunit
MIRGDTMLAVGADEAQDLNTPVPVDAEVHILPSIAGG